MSPTVDPTAPSGSGTESHPHADTSTPRWTAPAGALIETATIEGARVSIMFARAIASGHMNRSISEASTVTFEVLDPDDQLLRSQYWKQASRLRIPPNTYVLVQSKYKSRVLTLTFEDEVVYRLRQFDKPRKAFRSRVNRIDFARSLCREAGVKFYCPDVAPRAPLVAKTTTSPDDATGGFEAGAKITVTNHGHSPGSFAEGGARPWLPASPDQKKSLEIALTEAARLHATDTVMIAMVMAGTGESQWNRRAHGQGNPHYGLFQQSPNYYTRPDSYDPLIAAHEFLVGGKTWKVTDQPQAGSMMALMVGYAGRITLGEMILKRQLPNVADVGAHGEYYQAFYEESRLTVAAFSHPGTHNTRVLVDKFIFYRGRNGQREDSWQVLTRTFEEIGWRVFVGPDPRTGVRDTIWAASDPWLFGAKSVALLDRLHPDVDDISWKVDVNARTALGRSVGVDDLRIETTDVWGINPGVPVMLSEKEGPAEGKWLITDWDRDLFAPQSTISGAKPVKPLPEPVATSGGTPPSGTVPGPLPTSGTVVGNRAYPLAVWMPFDQQCISDIAGHHSRPLGNWQSDDAVDLKAPPGTPVFACEDCTVIKYNPNHVKEHSGNIFGGQLTMSGNGKSWFYTHIENVPTKIRSGALLKAGEQVGTVTRWDNDVLHSHLHFGMTPTNAEQYVQSLPPPVTP